MPDRPDFVLLDMNFVYGERSGAAGLRALAKVRATDPTLSVILMTAYGGVALAVDALKQGAVDFILKPWRNEKLVRAVTAAAEMTRARRGVETLLQIACANRQGQRGEERRRSRTGHATCRPALALSRRKK